MASRFTLTTTQMRAVDRAAIEEFQVPGVALMENAGRGATDVLLDVFSPELSGQQLIQLYR